MILNEFLENYQHHSIEHYPNQVLDQPLVSICIITYQHGHFIRECLESILMQEVDFPYEILLGEDESSDGTREICIDYANKYPEKIRLFLHCRENNIRINGKPTGRFNLVYTLFQARGKYLAFCEGDDCWLDPQKLNKQIRFLENNLTYSGVSCYAENLDQRKNNGEGVRSSKERTIIPRQHQYGSIFKKEWKGLRTCAVVYRNTSFFKDLPEWTFQVMSFDIVMFLSQLRNYGPVQVLPFIGALYRKHENGMWSSLNASAARVQQQATFSAVFNNLVDHRKQQVDYLKRHLKSTLMFDLKNKNFGFLFESFRMFRSIIRNG